MKLSLHFKQTVIRSIPLQRVFNFVMRNGVDSNPLAAVLHHVATAPPFNSL